VVQKLTAIGTQHLVDGRNPISLCNVLFVGNLCGLVVLGSVYGRQWHRANLKKISKQEWLGLVIVAILSGAIAPALIFQALATTNVNTVILVGRLEPSLTLVLSIWLLQEAVNRWQIGSAIAASIGVILAIGLQPKTTVTIPMLGMSAGECLVLGSAIALSASTIIGKKWLSRVSLGIYSTLRTTLGTIIFFIFASLLYGRGHFMDAFSPLLWQWMVIYGVVIVVLGQSFWIKGLRTSGVSAASVIATFTPLVGIIATYLLLGEIPTSAQYMGGSLILIGIGLNQVGLQLQMSRPRLNTGRLNTPTAQVIAAEMGFKGL
jgi:drug/metabolite transporter (DMT)-like permease